jgi:hypothetical protein
MILASEMNVNGATQMRDSRPTDDEPNRLGTLLSQLHTEADRLSLTHGVYDIFSYGWLDHDTPDPEYIGHAMWQTSPPFEPEWNAFFNGEKVSYTPTGRDEVLFLNSEDFAGTMIFARRSIGMAFCYASQIDPSKSTENQEFWHEHATSLQWLNIASDRIRDFFLMARFGWDKDQYMKKSSLPRGNRGAYAAPFHEALDTATQDNRERLNRLLPVAITTQKYRDLRNALVHEVATRTAQQSISLLHEQRKLAAEGPRPEVHSRHFDESVAVTIATQCQTQITTATEDLKLWYGNLVESSSLIFEFEYFSRGIKKP